MPKILFLITEDWFFLSHFLTMARTAGRLGFDVTVATRVAEGGERISSEGFRLVALDGDRKSLRLVDGLGSLVQYYRMIRRERPDIVHCIALRPVVLGGVAARLARTQALILAPTGLGHLWLEPGAFISGIRWTVRVVVGWLLRGPGTHFLFENSDDPGEFGLAADAKDVTILGGSGVSPDRFPFLPEPPAPPVKVAVVARMLSSKGIAEAVDAVQQARSKGAPVELSLFGDPDPSNPSTLSERKLREWSSIPGVHWHGQVPEVASVWKEHHIALLLSHREGLPRTLVEAAACGRPIVATDVVGCRELVRNGKEGFLVPLGDTKAAAEALAKLAGDPMLRTQMGTAANARFRERFTEDAVASAVARLYCSVAQL